MGAKWLWRFLRREKDVKNEVEKVDPAIAKMVEDEVKKVDPAIAKMVEEVYNAGRAAAVKMICKLLAIHESGNADLDRILAGQDARWGVACGLLLALHALGEEGLAATWRHKLYPQGTPVEMSKPKPDKMPN